MPAKELQKRHVRTALREIPASYLQISTLIHDLNHPANLLEMTPQWCNAVDTITNERAGGLPGYIQALREIRTVPTETDIVKIHANMITSAIEMAAMSPHFPTEQRVSKLLAHALMLPRTPGYEFLNPTADASPDNHPALANAFSQKTEAHQVLLLMHLTNGLHRMNLPQEEVDEYMSGLLSDLLFALPQSPKEVGSLYEPNDSPLLDFVLSTNNTIMRDVTVADYLNRIADLKEHEEHNDTLNTIMNTYLHTASEQSVIMLFGIKKMMMDFAGPEAFQILATAIKRKAIGDPFTTARAIAALLATKEYEALGLAATNLDMLAASKRRPQLERIYIRLMKTIASQAKQITGDERLLGLFAPLVSPDHAPRVREAAKQYIIGAYKNETRKNKQALLSAVPLNVTDDTEFLFEFAGMGLKSKDSIIHNSAFYGLLNAVHTIAKEGAFFLSASNAYRAIVEEHIESLFAAKQLTTLERSLLYQAVDTKTETKGKLTENNLQVQIGRNIFSFNARNQ